MECGRNSRTTLCWSLAFSCLQWLEIIRESISKNKRLGSICIGLGLRIYVYTVSGKNVPKGSSFRHICVYADMRRRFLERGRQTTAECFNQHQLRMLKHGQVPTTWDSISQRQLKFFYWQSDVSVLSNRRLLLLHHTDVDRLTLKILGVVIANGLLMSEHVRDVITLCAESAMQCKHTTYVTKHQLQPTDQSSVVIARLQYASSAWWGSAQPRTNSG